MPPPPPVVAPPVVISPTRAQWRENFIQKQLAGLKALGLSDAALAREEALLRGGFAAGTVGRPCDVV